MNGTLTYILAACAMRSHLINLRTVDERAHCDLWEFLAQPYIRYHKVFVIYAL